ncbi:MAG TPA: hypothetical protein DCF41_00185 [Arcobacter skirrowii]|nr:hypothetical protein [Aliarcobacter skirrowii]
MLVVPRDEVVVLSSNVPEIEDGIEVYDSNVAYDLGAIVQHNGCIYESMKDNNEDTPEYFKSTLSWIYKQRTNKYRMFDDLMSGSTFHENELIYELAVNDVDTVCFFGLQAESVKIEVYKDDELVYTSQKLTYERMVSNWWEWTVQKPSKKRVISFRNIPSFYGATLKVFVVLANGVAGCSNLIFGKGLDFGITLCEPAPTSSIRNVSSKEKQADGTVKTTISKVYKRVTLSVALDTNRVAEIQNFLEEHSLEPMLFVGVENDKYESLVVFGFYKDFDQPIGLEQSIYQIEIEGVV